MVVMKHREGNAKSKSKGRDPTAPKLLLQERETFLPTNLVRPSLCIPHLLGRPRRGEENSLDFISTDGPKNKYSMFPSEADTLLPRDASKSIVTSARRAQRPR
jgi:hypothetical protein